MRPEETGITSNYWKTKNSRRKKPNSLNYVVPISGEGIPETMFKAAKKQNSKIKVTKHHISLKFIIHALAKGWSVRILLLEEFARLAYTTSD